jgi:hypothetical protein
VKASDSDVEYCANSEDDYDYWECKKPAKKTKTVLWRPPTPPLPLETKPSAKENLDSVTTGNNFDVYSPKPDVHFSGEFNNVEICLPSVTEEEATLGDY